MGFVDRANKSILEYTFKHKISRWRICILFWLINMAAHNSRVIFNYLNNTNYSMYKFIESLCSQSKKNDKHILIDIEKPQRCKICYQKSKVDPLVCGSSKCINACSTCGAMHKKCFNSFHNEYLLNKIQK